MGHPLAVLLHALQDRWADQGRGTHRHGFRDPGAQAAVEGLRQGPLEEVKGHRRGRVFRWYEMPGRGSLV